MLRSSITYFARRAAAEQFLTKGITVLFRGVEITVRITPSAPDISLVRGGYRQKQMWKILFPLSVSPPPAFQEEIKDPATQKTYIVKSCVPATGSPASQEHIVEASWS